jgi:hypothetical protein
MQNIYFKLINSKILIATSMDGERVDVKDFTKGFR